jgi:hypothetical protein
LRRSPEDFEPLGAGPSRRGAGGRAWRVAEFLLFPIWALAAAITMFPELGRTLRLSGTVFSSYAADLCFPPWFYIVCRHRPAGPVARWIGRSPGVAAGSIFAVGVASEFAQWWFPRLVTGTFDPLDIAAYAMGLATCFAIERFARPASGGDRAASPDGSWIR